MLTKFYHGMTFKAVAEKNDAPKMLLLWEYFQKPCQTLINLIIFSFFLILLFIVSSSELATRRGHQSSHMSRYTS